MWIRAQDQDTIIDDLCDLAQVFNIAESGAGREALARASLVHLQSQSGPWLLVYDNAESLGAIRRWRPAGGDVRVIITSRVSAWPEQYQVQQTDRLPLSDATDLLLQEAERVDAREDAELLAKALDGLPLALVNAGAWLRDAPNTSFSEYHDQLRTRLRDNPVTVDDYAESAYGAVSLSFDKLSFDAQTVLGVLAFLSPDGIDVEIFLSLSGKDHTSDRYSPIHDSIWALCARPENVEQALAELARFSIIDRVGNGWRIHRVVQLIWRMNIEDFDGSWASAAAVVAASYPGKEPGKKSGATVSDASQWDLCKKLTPHIGYLKAIPDSAIISVPFEYLLNQASIYLSYNGISGLSLQYSIEYLRRKNYAHTILTQRLEQVTTI